MRFVIYPKLGWRHYKVIVDYLGIDGDVERFKVYGKQPVIIESNRPRLRRLKLKKWEPKYKMVGQNTDAQLYFATLVSHIKEWVKDNLE